MAGTARGFGDGFSRARRASKGASLIALVLHTEELRTRAGQNARATPSNDARNSFNIKEMIEVWLVFDLYSYIFCIDAVPVLKLPAYQSRSATAWKPPCGMTSSNAPVMDGV
ncbi:hypothetical protein [Paraburkholderia nodosa]|uniref:hypothetical protein n=1 Tax=Paraburkholderia nodosa TaxID=392320 RepID=UPI00114D13ED|nr:hypothetical protein [Paraburkholderia nodosa]